MLVIGIDPGLDGAIAVIADSVVQVEDAPVATVKAGKKNRRILVPAAMAAMVEGAVNEAFVKGEKVCVYIEKVHAMPKQGVASTFNFGMGYGLWLGIMAARRLAVTQVTPQAWKKVMLAGMPRRQGAGKDDAHRLRALELWPELTEQLKLKKNEGRAAALLIAQYGRQHRRDAQ